MFSKGDTILYRPTGVCEIADIRKETIAKNTNQYYILKPVYRPASTIYVPVDNEKLTSHMCELISKQEAKSLLENGKKGAIKWLDDSKKRVIEYNEALFDINRGVAIEIIKLLQHHKREVLLTNHKFYATDEKILTIAERLIGEEFAFVLGKQPEEILQAIKE